MRVTWLWLLFLVAALPATGEVRIKIFVQDLEHYDESIVAAATAVRDAIARRANWIAVSPESEGADLSLSVHSVVDGRIEGLLVGGGVEEIGADGNLQDAARAIARQIENYVKREQDWLVFWHPALPRLDAVFADLDSALQQKLGITRNRGVVFTEVFRRGVSALDGVRAGDVVERVNDKPIRRAHELTELLMDSAPGDRIVLGLRRGQERLELMVTLSEPKPLGEPSLSDLRTLIEKAPELEDAQDLEIGRVSPIGDEGKGFFVELEWRDAGDVQNAVAAVGHRSIGFPDTPTPGVGTDWIATEEEWGLLQLNLGATWDDLIQGLQTARTSTNERAVMNDLESFLRAQEIYLGAVGGYGTPDCLAQPWREGCIPGYPADAPSFIFDVTLVEGSKHGYVRTFYPGPTEGGKMSRYAVTAVPAEPGESGERSFCADDTKLICAVADGELPRIEAGRCAQPCEEVSR